jgi:hypothetical protein
MRHVDADDPAGGSHLPGGKEAIDTGAAAKIDNDFVRSHGRECLGITAAKPEIGALGQGSELGFGIAHAARGLLRGGRRAASRATGRDAAVSVANEGLGVRGVHAGVSFGSRDNFDTLRNVLDKAGARQQI